MFVLYAFASELIITIMLWCKCRVKNLYTFSGRICLEKNRSERLLRAPRKKIVTRRRMKYE